MSVEIATDVSETKCLCSTELTSTHVNERQTQ